MSQIGLNSNIYNVSNKYLEKFNDFLVNLNYNPAGITVQQREEIKLLVKRLLDEKSNDYQIQMVYMVVDDYLKGLDKKSETVLKSLLTYLEGNTVPVKMAAESLEMITTALDRECDFAFSRIQKR